MKRGFTVALATAVLGALAGYFLNDFLEKRPIRSVIPSAQVSTVTLQRLVLPSNLDERPPSANGGPHEAARRATNPPVSNHNEIERIVAQTFEKLADLPQASTSVGNPLRKSLIEANGEVRGIGPLWRQPKGKSLLIDGMIMLLWRMIARGSSAHTSRA